MEDDKSARPEHGIASNAVVGIWDGLGAHSSFSYSLQRLAQLIGSCGNAAETAVSLSGQVPLPRSPKFPLVFSCLEFMAISSTVQAVLRYTSPLGQLQTRR